MVHSSLSVPTFDTLSFVGLERSHLRSAVYRRVFGDDTGPVRIGRYSILERIGSGARGVVFKAFDNQLDRLVALKVLSTRAGHQAELLREAKALARLSHPNVLPVYEVGETDEGQVFLATEYVKGWTLRGWYDEEHRSEAAIVDVMRQVALGVQAAHDEGLVHRDLKPANILLGGDGRVRVADFGLARFDPTAVEPNAELPADGLATTTAGTPGYMAPELFDGRPASAASDQYALAVTLHELLAGELPTSAERVSVRRTRSSSVIRRGLSLAPEDRYPSVRKFADALAPRTSRGKLGTAALVGAGMLFLGGIGAGALVRSATGDENSSSEVARLKAKTELPDRPAAALQALRRAPNLDDPSLLPVAAQALSLNPATAVFKLPPEAEHPRLFGEFFFHRDGDSLKGHQLSAREATPLDPTSLGLSGGQPNFYTVPTQVFVDDDATFYRRQPWAFENFDRQDRSFALSKDGSRIARYDGKSRTISVMNLADKEVVWTYETPEGEYVKVVDIDNEGFRVSWAFSDGRAFVHDLRADVTYPLEVSATRVLFEAEEEMLVVRGRDAGVYRLRLSDNQKLHLFPADQGYQNVQLSPDQAWVAAAASDERTVFVVEPEGIRPYELEGGAFAFSPDSRFLATADGERVRVLHLASGDVQEIPSGGKVHFVQFGSDGALWSMGSDGYVRRHQVEAPGVLVGHSSPVSHLSLSSDGSQAVSFGRDFKLRMWDVQTEVGRTLADLDWSVSGLMLDEEGARVAVVQMRGDTRFFDVRTGVEQGTAPRSASALSMGPGGAIVGASKQGVWSNLDGVTTFVADNVGACVASTATDALIAAVCGEEGDYALHLWMEGEHHETPVDDPQAGDDLHVWPDSRHLLRYGHQKTLFAFSETGRLSPASTVQSLAAGRPLNDPSKSTRFGDLLTLRDSAVYSMWGPDEEPIRLAEAGTWGPIAISADGRTYGYANGNNIIIRKRELSALRPNLAEVLAAHEVVEGEL